jgi:hypothetical protein
MPLPYMSNIIAPVPATFTTNMLSELILVLPGRTGDGDDGTVLSESCCSEFLALHPNYPTVRLALALNLRCYYPLPLAQTGTQVHSLAWQVSPETKQCRNLNWKVWTFPSKPLCWCKFGYSIQACWKLLRSQDTGIENVSLLRCTLHL